MEVIAAKAKGVKNVWEGMSEVHYTAGTTQEEYLTQKQKTPLQLKVEQMQKAAQVLNEELNSLISPRAWYEAISDFIKM